MTTLSGVAYRARQAETFKALETEPQDWLWTGEFIETRNLAGHPVGVCDLCGEQGLANKFFIKVKQDRPKAGLQIGVGSTCIGNYMFAEEADEYKFRQALKMLQNKVKIVNYMTKNFGITFQEAVRIYSTFKLKLTSYTGLDQERWDAAQREYQQAWHEAQKNRTAITVRQPIRYYFRKKFVSLTVYITEKQELSWGSRTYLSSKKVVDAKTFEKYMAERKSYGLISGFQISITDLLAKVV